MPDATLHPRIRRRHAAVRRAWVLRHALRAAGVAAVAIAAGVALGAAWPTGPGFAWVRLALVALVSLGALAVAVARLGRDAPSFDVYLERVETRFPEVRSWLRNSLDFERQPAAHASRELERAVAEETARRVADLPLAALTPPVRPLRPLLALGGSLVLVLALGAAFPGRVSRSWATLLDPGAAAPPVRLVVEPGSVRLAPGSALAVRARVWGTSQTPLLWRQPGSGVPPVAEGRDDAGARVWRFDLAQLTRDQLYGVRVGRVRSPRYRISLAGEPAPVSFDITLRAPAYARLPEQHGAATRGDLSALAGSRAAIEVTFDRDLTSLEASLPDGRVSRWSAVTPRRWRGEVPIEREGSYTLHATAARGEGRFRYVVSPLPDAPPVLVVRVPQSDVDLPAGQQVPLSAIAQDDLGLGELRLQYRREPTAPWTTLPLTRFGTHPREARVDTHWDASGLGLLPGQSATFRLELLDDNRATGPGRAYSPAFELRFPSLADLYQDVERRQGDVVQSLQKAADRAREMQESLDKLSREAPRPGVKSPPAFERKEELQQNLDRQQELTKQLDDASRELRRSLDDAAERHALDDQLQQKMQEMSRLLDQVQSPEFRDAVRRMQEALKNMDPRALERTLPEWRDRMKDMIRNLDRSIALLQQLREEEKLHSLAQRAEELKAQQDQLNQEQAEGSPPEGTPEKRPDQADRARADRQEQAGRESQQLAKEVRESAEKQSGDARERMDKAADELEQQASPSQQQASESMRGGNSQQAMRSGARASRSLARASEGLSQLSREQREARQGADLAAVRRSAQDLVSLERVNRSNFGPEAPADDRADRQTALSEGVGRVADSLFALARRSPFITRELATALGRAMQELGASGRELAGGDRSGGEQSSQLASEAINQAVLQLRQIESSMCQKPGQGAPQPQGSLSQQMGRMGQQQGQLNRETESVAQRLTRQLRMTTGDREQLEQLAQRQSALREQLERIQQEDARKDKLLGKLDAAHQEMKEVEEALRRGQSLGDVEQKQQRILSRMLDAARSVNRRDYDPQRESRPGEDVARRSPDELSPDLLRAGDRLRLDLLRTESDRYPAQYRGFVEAYLRSLNRSGR